MLTMKFLHGVFLLISISFYCNFINGDYVYKVKYLEVPLDHFSYATNKTFQLRYLVNDTFSSDESDAILFYTGNEGDIELFAQNTGYMWELASEIRAIVVFAEHRYYGQSLPFGNKSYDSPEHLGYLTSEQALADYADLLRVLNPKYERPVIALGGSYGGMLSAWFRMKYPHLIAGALAASAPILQFEDVTPCDVFNRILTSVFTTAYTEDCSRNIKKSWDVLKNLSSNDAGRALLNAKFNFCTNLTKAEDLDQFFDYLNDVYGNLAMANYPYPNNFLAPLPAYPVRSFCARLNQSFDGVELIDALQKAVSVYSNFTGQTKCLDIKSAYDPSMGTLGWDFQACSEMVMPMCSGTEHDMFPERKWDLKRYSDDCFKKFGVHPRDRNAVTIYGGRRIETATNIIFSNGLLDPWSGGGVLRSPNDQVHILIIPDGAHHVDLRASHADDSGSTIAARKVETKIITKWIEEYEPRY